MCIYGYTSYRGTGGPQGVKSLRIEEGNRVVICRGKYYSKEYIIGDRSVKKIKELIRKTGILSLEEKEVYREMDKVMRAAGFGVADFLSFDFLFETKDLTRQYVLYNIDQYKAYYRESPVIESFIQTIRGINKVLYGEEVDLKGFWI